MPNAIPIPASARDAKTLESRPLDFRFMVSSLKTLGLPKPLLHYPVGFRLNFWYGRRTLR